MRARVTKVKRGYRGGARRPRCCEPAPQRVEAPCAHYPACGGCRFQDLAYEAQTAAKAGQVARRAAPDRRASPSRRSSRPCRPTRRSSTATSSSTRSRRPPDGPTLGFHKAGRWDEVLEVERCWLTTDLGNAIRNAVREWAREEGLVAYDQADGSGYLRHLVVREGRNTGQVLVQLVTAPGERFETGYFVEVLRRFPEVRSIHWAVNDTPAEVTNLPSTLLWGEEAIEEELLRPALPACGRTPSCRRTRRWRSGCTGSRAEAAGLTGGETVCDLYCGIGTIGLVLAPRRAHRLGHRGLRGVGRVRARERRAERRSRTRPSSPATSGEVDRGARATGRASPTSSSSTRRAPGWPGRRCAGSGRIEAPRIVYVSCNPTTLAGDAKRLADDWGYGSCARGRWTCSRTRRTSRRSRCSSAGRTSGGRVAGAGCVSPGRAGRRGCRPDRGGGRCGPRAGRSGGRRGRAPASTARPNSSSTSSVSTPSSTRPACDASASRRSTQQAAGRLCRLGVQAERVPVEAGERVRIPRVELGQ